MRSEKQKSPMRSSPALLLVALLGFTLSYALHASALLSAEERPRFQKQRIKIANKILTVEIADTDDKREYGLMFRDKLNQDEGMLFIFDGEQRLSFWMKNTMIPLSIGYFDSKKVLLETHEMRTQVLGEIKTQTYPSHDPALYALEMPKDWFRHNGIRSGTSFTFVEKP